ncbi:hypothetical protein DERP_012815 [Dermatophagoides pteronyssinus]|uniref:Uncharacterized protein n=1 Tax=Dermatophagoides pteronyssinus TaxID=6956 RepID=A0ABQ8JFP7_DERPT|nr:hypothetical protein DERP_012815 [Dermatophagoides pteronyssinus]
MYLARSRSTQKRNHHHVHSCHNEIQNSSIFHSWPMVMFSGSAWKNVKLQKCNEKNIITINLIVIECLSLNYDLDNKFLEEKKQINSSESPEYSLDSV